MMNRALFFLRDAASAKLAALLTFAVVMSGCTGTQPVTYYQLSTRDAGQTAGDAGAIGDAVIGIGPVRLPELLDRPQIVTRQSSNRLQLSASHRWVEPLAENITRVLRENLSALLDTERFLLYPWNRAIPADYQIIIDILRFEGAGYQTAGLEAVWSVRDKTGMVLLSQRRSTYQVTAMSPDYEGLVSALSKTLSLFCLEIGKEIARMVSEK